MSVQRIVRRGLKAGFVGATAMAAWFLFVDALAGNPLATPAFVAGAIFGGTGAVAWGPVALYSLLHYAAFLIVGVGVSALLARVRVSAPLLLGAVVGFLLFDAVFYLGMVVTGVDVVSALGWPEVLAGNVLAGLALLVTLHRAGATASGPIWIRHLLRTPVVCEGLVLGVAGAALLAVWFLIVDLTQGRPFYTPGALGSSLLLGATRPDQVVIGLRTVLAYTAVHGLLWAATGIVAAAVARAAERQPPLILAAGMIFVALEALFLGLVALAAESVLGPAAWWSAGVGNLLAALLLGRLLWRGHPRLVAEVRGGALLTSEA